jgi:transposase InsO family protein
MKILFDTGSGATLINRRFITKLKTVKAPGTEWITKAGKFTTSRKCRCTFTLPEFHAGRDITWNMYVDETDNKLSRYDMIIGRDLLDTLGFDMLFSQKVMIWDNASVPMRNPSYLDAGHIDDFEREIFSIHDPDTTESERIQNILDVKYAPADLEAIARESKHLTKHEQELLYKLLCKYAHLFDGTLGTWDVTPIDLELKEPEAKPSHAKPYPVPHSQEQKLREEVERLLALKVLRKINHSEWAAPMFTVMKKDQTLRSIADFRELNKKIKRKPFPIPKIQGMLQRLEGFMYATSLDLNMGYYHILLTPYASTLCTVVLPWGKYEYLRLPMGLCNSPDIFQEKMNDIMTGLEFAQAYIDDLLVISCGDFEDHLNKLEQVLTRLSESGLKVNASKSFFGKEELEYLGYWITREGIKPLSKKVEAISNIAAPRNRRELRRFIGIVNYYRDMWIRRSEVLSPLTALTSVSVKWKWTEVEQTAFDTMKRIMAREVILAYPNFNQPFHIHTDASKTQLGAVISQNDRPIAFYSRKLNPAQTRYTTTERELLSIVETLKEFRNILLGQQLIVHTDHENLTYKNFNSDRVMRWRLFIEEYSPDLKYIKGENNIVADALSRLDIAHEPLQEAYFTDELRSELYCYAQEDLTPSAFPLSYQVLGENQSKDKQMLKTLQKKDSKYHLKSFQGGGKHRDLICYNDKIVVPASQQVRIVDWYHTYLGHPGINRTEETISQHLWWPNMRKHITVSVSTCASCQRNKRRHKKYGHLPEKEAEAMPWDKMCIDLIGPYVIRRKGKSKKDLVCKCVTMIDPATGWFEIHQYNDKRSVTVANIAEQEWFSRYPWPTQVTYDRGSEFVGHDFQDMLKNDYGIKRKPITVRNPQANAIVERIHQVIGNIIRTFELQDNYLDEEDPWKGILSATAFAVRATYHTTLQKTPGQLVFGRDMIFNVQHAANWEYIRARKQKLIKKNNENENKKRIPHTYAVGDQVMLRNGAENKYEQPYSGPHSILQVNTNGTVRLQIGAITDTINIRRIDPYKKAPDSIRGGECNMRLSKNKRH